jgi:hypothetical protein
LGFSNADYAFDLDDWTSTTTKFFLLGSTPISWCCVRNKIQFHGCHVNVSIDR